MANVSWDVFRNRSHDNRAAEFHRPTIFSFGDAKAAGVDPEALLDALKRSWDGTRFRCHHTGLPLTTSDSSSPLYLAVESRDKAGENQLVVVATIVHGLAATLSSVAFQEVCLALRDRMNDDQRRPLSIAPIRRRLRVGRLSGSRTPRARGR